MAAFFIGMDIYAAGLAGAKGLVSIQLFWLVGLLVFPLIAGAAIGNRRFLNSRPESFKRLALLLLVVVSSAGLLCTLLPMDINQ